MRLSMQGIFLFSTFSPQNTVDMRQIFTIFFLAGVLCCASCTPAKNPPSEQASASPTQRLSIIKNRLQSHIQTMQNAARRLDSLALGVLTDTARQRALQQAFHESRVAYKRAEWAIEYFAAQTAHEINGAPIDEFEEQDKIVIPATGFQVLEESLFPQVKPKDSTTIRFNTRTILSLTTRAQQVVKSQELTDAHIFDALWLEIARVQTLGVSGFDAPVLLTGVADAALVLEEMQVVVENYASAQKTSDSVSKAWKLLQTLFAQAIAECRRSTDFATFDRAAWFTGSVNPLAAQLKSLQAVLNIAPLPFSSAFRAEARHIFDSAAFNVLHFAPVFAREFSAEQRNAQIALGKQLFYDPVLSGNGTRACASCHQPDKAFTDGLRTSAALTPTGKVQRNAPTLVNVALQTAQFLDLRVAFLEDQASAVVQNVDEMHGSLAEAVRRLSADKSYKQAFMRSFGDSSQTPVNELRIKQAIASFERSLVALNSRFDRCMRGDTTALSATEKRGFNLYMGKAKCGTCHFAPLFNGTVPPVYLRTEQEVIGVPRTAKIVNASIDGDVGRFAINGYVAHKYAFKTPTVRNSSLTAPYMHNGVFPTLEQVMDFYNRGGGAGIGVRGVEHQTLSPDPLHLTPSEQQAIIAFLRSLEDVPQ
jgi:cytochrome c peroxidase